MIDPPSADVTAHVVEMLAEEGRASDPRVRKAVDWLLREQETDGSWFGRWGANHLYGTGAALPALIRAGVDPSHPAIRRAVRWLEACQNEDGGWGEDLRSYAEAARRGRGTSTASQTAWALLALLAADGASDAIERGIGWLVDTQREDGGWEEPQFTGTGFPGDFYINYHLYSLHFPADGAGPLREILGVNAGLAASPISWWRRRCGSRRARCAAGCEGCASCAPAWGPSARGRRCRVCGPRPLRPWRWPGCAERSIPRSSRTPWSSRRSCAGVGALRFASSRLRFARRSSAWASRLAWGR